MLAFSPGFPLFLKFMKHPITALNNFIFAPSQPLEVPQPPDSTLPATTTDFATSDVSMGPVEAAHEPAAPSPEPTPFGTLLDSFVDIPASLRDDHHHRTPTVLSSGLPDPVLGTATPLVKLSPLLNYLNQHLTPHLRSHIGTSIQSCFVTLIIGPSTDVRVGAALHSHLVCAAVAPSNEDYSVLFIPSDLLTDFACPIEWQPLFLYLAASLAYPDLPFLVTTPDYMAGALCTAQGLRSVLHNSCPHIPPDAMDTGPLVNSPHPPLTLSSEPAGGWGAVQYYFHFRPDSTAISLTQLTPELHQLPRDFSTSILSYENWAPPEDLFQVTPPPPQIPLLSSRFLARSSLPTPHPTMASPFVTGLHLPLEPHLVALPSLSQTTTTNTPNQPAFGLLMHVIHRIAVPPP